jgi:tetratricopeptide (TPR) repeat protein
MKRIQLLLITVSLPLLLIAQTQQGIVKTQGLANKPGQPLSGVTIRWRGAMNAVLSGKDGKFSAAFPGKKNGDAISLLNVSKTGYELLNPDMLRQQLVFSTSVPVEIVMADSKVLEANKRRISENAYRKAEETFQAKVKVLKKQLEESKITEAECSRQLQTLQDNYEKYVDMIEGMAERYARTDYDHLDSLDREINICIENGEFDKADSLIHTVFDPTTVLERNRAAKAAVQEKMQLAQEIIDRANADRDALRRDADYARRVDVLCLALADEYLVQDNKPKALECLQQSLAIRQIIYGEESEEVKVVKQKIKTIQL